MLPPVNPADRGAVSQKTGLPPRGRRGPGAGHPPRLADADPVRRSRQARTKILDTLVEILEDTASDAGSTPAASTIFRIRIGSFYPQNHPQTRWEGPGSAAEPGSSSGPQAEPRCPLKAFGDLDTRARAGRAMPAGGGAALGSLDWGRP